MSRSREVRFQLRQSTAEQFAESNPILLAGEPAVETDEWRIKVGDGVQAYNDLPYVLAPDPTYDLADLTTEDKSSLVAAINELNAVTVSFTSLYHNAKAG